MLMDDEKGKYAAHSTPRSNERGKLSLQRVRAGLRHGEFVVAYQPVVNARTFDLLAVECLIRWQHPERGLLLPDAFSDALDDLPTARDVSYFVLDTACRHIAALHRTGVPAPRATINVLPSQLADRELSERLSEVTSRHDVDPALIELELLETEDASRVLSVRSCTLPFDKLGVRFALDDFGTGYSSLSVLSSMRIQTIKLDRAFISAIPASTRACNLLTGIFQMLDRLGFMVIVEGVETAEQLRWIALHPGVFVQGYFICRPQMALHKAVGPFN